MNIFCGLWIPQVPGLSFFSLISFLQFLISCESCRFDSTHILLSSWNHTVTRFVHRYFPWGLQFFCINVWWDWVEVFCRCCFGGLIGQFVSFIFYLFIYFLVSFFQIRRLEEIHQPFNYCISLSRIPTWPIFDSKFSEMLSCLYTATCLLFLKVINCSSFIWRISYCN